MSVFSTLLDLAQKIGIENALDDIKCKSGSSVQDRKLSIVNIDSDGYGEFCRTAANAIVYNLIDWLDTQRTAIPKAILVTHLQIIDNLVRQADERAMLGLSLLLHVSKADILIFGKWVLGMSNRPVSFVIVNDQNEIPTKDTLDKALEYLKSDLIATKLSEFTSESLESRMDSSEVVKVINKLQIRFVKFADRNVRAWTTANGVAINVEAVSKKVSYTLLHPVALCCIIGQELQHYLRRHQKDDFNLSSPDSILSETDKGLFFEQAVFGDKFNFSKEELVPKQLEFIEELLELLTTKMSTSTKLPLLTAKEIQAYSVFKANCDNKEFAFDYVTPRIFE